MSNLIVDQFIEPVQKPEPKKRAAAKAPAKKPAAKQPAKKAEPKPKVDKKESVLDKKAEPKPKVDKKESVLDKKAASKALKEALVEPKVEQVEKPKRKRKNKD
jgi:hypothetical protein